MKASKIITFSALFLMTGASLVAQDTVTMNLKECMRYAVEHSTKIRIQHADNRDAQIDRRDAILAAFTPSVSGSSSASYSFGRSLDPETNTYGVVTSFYNGYSLSAGITLFDGFRAVNNMKITKTAQQMGFTKEQQLEDQICLATMEAYCNVLYYTEMEKALQAQVATAEKAVQLATKQEQLGQKSHADVVQVQSDLAEKQYLLTTCRNNLNNVLITLKDVMFWPIDEPLKIDGLDVGLSHRGSMIINDSLSRLPYYYSPTDQSDAVSSLVSRAKQWLPEVALAEGTMKNARLALKTARWQLLPRLSLSGGWSSSFFTYPGREGYVPTPFINQLKDNGGESVSLSLSIPIFDRLSKHSNIAKRKNAYDRAQTNDLLIFADEGQIMLVFNNLIKNAIQAGANSIRITADLNADDQTVIRVTNNGKPIPLRQIEEIFIPFYTTKPNGTGIGLSLSRQIMIKHHDNLHLE